MQKTAFVTGATGFLGLNLVDQLCAAGWHVTAMHRHTSSLSWLSRFPVELVVGDLLSPDTLFEAIPEGCDVVFHAAADNSLWTARHRRQWRTNVLGTHRLLEAAQAKHVGTFVYTSSWATYGLECERIDEESPQLGKFSPRHFDRTKALAEEAVRDACRPLFKTVILNPAVLIGPYDHDAWTHMLRLAHVGRLAGIPPGGAEFCHAGAVAQAHIAAAEIGEPGANYLLGGIDAQFIDVVRIIGELTGNPVPRRPMARWWMRFLARMEVIIATITRNEPDLTPDGATLVLQHPTVDTTRAEDELGYRRASLDDMLGDTYLWMKAEGLVR